MSDAQTDSTESLAPSHDAATHTIISKDRDVEANQIIIKYSAFGFGGGVIPFPLIDVAAVAGVQVKMLADLSKLYEVEFVDNWGKSVLSALMGGVVPHILAVGTFGSLVKAIPVLGSAVGFATMSILSAATTYAVGKVFMQHFESGGTFLDFDAKAARGLFQEQYAQGKEMFKKAAKSARERGVKLKDIKFDMNVLRRGEPGADINTVTITPVMDSEPLATTPSSAPVTLADQDVSGIETLVALPDEESDENGEKAAPVRRQRRPRLRTSSV